ncbi:peroxisomal biogenesis factor 3-like [Tubulanus polymorphus]|uniref:peroxisomal biogenesis factor 3-like n=1 Tax=Tubulanus polymorphus TaxID=672921 RepID=UPI003DA2D8C8
MFGRVWNFLKRHRRKFLWTGVVVSGVYVTGRYALYKLKQLQEKDAADCLEHARKQHHFDSNQRTCNTTVLSMIPSLREAIVKILNTEEMTASLKNNPENRLEIWEDLKIESFVRSIVSVYGSCLLAVVLRVKLNVIGGYMYLDSCMNRNGMSKELSVATNEIQQIYLERVQFILNEGLQLMIKDVTESVQHEIGSKSLKENLTLCDIDHILRNVRQHLEHRDQQQQQHPFYHLCRYIIPSQDLYNENTEILASRQDRFMHQLINETTDMFESTDFRSVLSNCLDKGFSRLVDRISDYFKPPSNLSSEHVKIPLAKLIPITNGLIYIVLADIPNQFIQEILLMDEVKDFAANIYEAFSQPPLHNIT